MLPLRVIATVILSAGLTSAGGISAWYLSNPNSKFYRNHEEDEDDIVL